MLHIILTILKILGILLLVILGILLAVVLAVLFVPICYSAQGKKNGDELSGKATVSWLFYLLHGKVVYEGGKTGFEIYLFGIPLMKVKQKLDARKTRKQRKQKEEQVQTEPSTKPEVQKAAEKSAEGSTAELKTTQQEKVNENKPEDRIQQSGTKVSQSPGTVELTKDPQKKKTGITEKAAGVWRKVKGIILKIWHFPSDCIKKLKKIKLTFRTICDKIKQCYTFLQMNTTKAAFRFIKGKVKLLLRHILPRKIWGNLTFGLDDPAVTGQILAVAGICYPVYKENLRITPVFDQKILEGELKLRGRICCGYLLLIGWQIFWNKDVKVTYQRFQHKEA